MPIENPRELINKARALAESRGLNDPGDLDRGEIIRAAAARVLQERAAASGDMEKVKKIRNRLYQQPRNYTKEPITLDETIPNKALKLGYQAIRGSMEINPYAPTLEQLATGKGWSLTPLSEEERRRKPGMTADEEIEAVRQVAELREMERRDVQENFGSRVARGAGGISQFLTNLAMLKGIPGLGGSSIPAGMARFGIHEAALPELKEAQGGPEAEGTIEGRFAKGALLDLALRGVGGVTGAAAKKAIPGTGKIAEAARGATSGAATGATFGAATAPPGERGVQAAADALIFGPMGSAGALPWKPKSKAAPEPQPQPRRIRGAERVETEPYDATQGPQVRYRTDMPPERGLGNPPGEMVAHPERPVGARETPQELGLPPETMEAYESSEYRTFVLPDGKKLRVLPPPEGEGVTQEPPRPLGEIKAETEQRQLPSPEEAPVPEQAPRKSERVTLPEETPYEPFIAKDTGEPLEVLGGYKIKKDGGIHREILKGEAAKPTATENDISLLNEHGVEGLREKGFYGVLDRLQTSGKAPLDAERESGLGGPEHFYGGIPAPFGKEKSIDLGKAAGGVLSRAKETFFEPGKATAKGQEAWKSDLKRISKAVEFMSPRLRRALKIETPDKLLEDLDKSHKGGLDRVRGQFLKAEDKGSKLSEAEQVEFWRTLEKNGELPPDHPLKDVEREYKDLVLASGDAMVRADPEFFGAVETHRQPGQGYVKRVPSKEQLATDLAKRTKDLMKGLAQWKLGGLKRVAASHEKAMASAKSPRAPFTTEEVESTRVYLKSRGPEGKPVYGELVGKDRKTITIKSDTGKTLTIPRKNISRIDKPYQTGLKVVLKTIQEQGAILEGLKVFERVVDEPQFKEFWHEPKGASAPPGWRRINDPSFGVLNGKDVSESLYHFLKPITSREQPGWKKLAWTINGAVKEGVTIGRLPGYIIKNALGETPMMLWALGTSPAWMPVRVAQGFKAVSNALNGNKDQYVKELMRGIDGRGLFLTNPHLQDILEGGADYSVANFRDVDGRGIGYLKKWLIHSAANAQTRLAEMAKRRNKGLEEPSILGYGAEVMAIVKDALWGADVGRALGVKSKYLHLSGEGARDIVGFLDAVTRYAAYRHLRETGGVGEIRMAGRLLAGKKPIPKGMPEKDALYKIYQVTDPGSVKGPANTLGRMTFWRTPYQLFRHFVFERGALVNPIAAYMAWQLGSVITSATVSYLRQVKGWVISDDEVEKQLEQMTFGNPEQVKTIGIIGGDVDENGRVSLQGIDMLAFILADFPSSAIPGPNVQPQANEPAIRRVVRGVAAQIPVASMIWRFFEGEEALTGEPLERSLKRNLVESLVPFVPGAATYAQRIRGEESKKRAEDAKRGPVAGDREILLRGLLGVKFMRGYPSDSKEGKAQKELIEYLNEKEDLIKTPGAKFREVLKKPLPPPADASDEEMENYQKLLRAYLKNRRPRRR